MTPCHCVCLCLCLCEKTYSNDAMKPAKMKHHLERPSLFQDTERKTRSNSKTCFKAPSSVDSEAGLKASYNISLMITKKGKTHTIGEEIIIPAIKEVKETVMKKDSHSILKNAIK